MEIKSIKCPECGANILMHDDEEITFCSHCGTQLHISPYKEKKKYDFSFNEKSKVQKLKIQESRMQQEERERLELRKIRLAEEQKFSKTMWRFRWVRWACFALMLLTFYFEMTTKDHITILTLLVFVAYCFLLIISIVNFIVHLLRKTDFS